MKTKTNAQRYIIKVGEEVRLTAEATLSHICPKGRENNATAKVWSIGRKGEVHLSRDLKGCRHWNVDDLIPSAFVSQASVFCHTLTDAVVLRLPISPDPKMRAMQRRVEARRRIKNLKRFSLMRWVNHDNSCSVRHGDWHNEECSCGLNRKLKELGLA
jgi:hypothetical protein